MPARSLNRASLMMALSGCIEAPIRPSDLPPPSFSDPAPVTPVSWTDEIVQVLKPQADVLWTIDNSCSMDDEQQKLAENFPIFIDYFIGSGLDFHVGVTSTDLDGTYNGASGKLREIEEQTYLDEDTADPIGIFTAMATMGTTGSGSEKGIGATYVALETQRDGFNAGFYRDEASLHTIIITDEPDYTPSAIVSLDEFVDWFDGLKDDAEDRTFSCIVDADGGEYVTASESIGGLAYSEAQDWAPLLDRLGVQAAGFKREYFLSHLPIVDTLNVSVRAPDGTLLDEFVPEPIEATELAQGDWSYDAERNSITFLEYLPEPLATVLIQYDLAAATVDGE